MSEAKPSHNLLSAGTGRLETLSDGVFAIVLTLLVFNINIPPRTPNTELAHSLTGLWPSFLSFVICAAFVGVFWTGHHAMYGYICRTSYRLNWLNMLFLGLLSLLPFSSSLLAEHHQEPLAVAVLGINLLLISGALLVMWFHATYRRRLVPHDLPQGAVRFGYSRIAFAMVGFALATVVGVVHVPSALCLFLLIPLVYFLPPLQRAWVRAYGMSMPGELADGDPE